MTTTTTTTMRTSSFKTALPSPSSGPVLTSSRSTRRQHQQLRGSGSVKGTQSPGLFASVGGGGRRRGGGGGGAGGFETAEPTSPKVTCIGQVRVKTGRKMMRKKKNKSTSSGAASLNRSRSRRIAGGDMGYRSAGVQGGICDAVRAFGSEINCFLLCGAGGGRSSVCCSGSDRDKVDGAGGAGGGGGKRVGSSSCGAAFARWIMAVNETEGVGVNREVEAAVEEDHMGGGGGADAVEVGSDDEEELVEERQFRRGIRALELLADELEKKGMDFSMDGGGFGGIVADAPVCAPPKNALLLMRCRADPVKLSALESRFREAKVVEVDDDEENAAAPAAAVGTTRALEDGNNGGGTKDAVFTRQVHEVKLKDHNFTAEATAMHDTLQHLSDSKSSSMNAFGEGECLPKLDEKKEEEPLEPLGHEEGANFAVESPEKAPEQEGITMEEEENLGQVEESSNLVEEADEVEEKRVVLVESLQVAADDSEAEKENKEVVRFPLQTPHNQIPEKPEKKLIRRDLLLAGGEMEGRRWSFSKEREPSVGLGGIRRHSFSTEEARRSSSFRDKEGTRRSSYSYEGVSDSVRRSSSFSSSDRGGERDRDAVAARRGRRSITKDKDPRRRSVDESATEGIKKPAASGTTAAATSTAHAACREGIEVSETAMAGRTFGGRDVVIKRRGDGDDAGGGDDDDDDKELPDCLLLMMYEPKLSMEISKETWVSTDDFQRWKPHHRRRAHQQQQNCRSSGPKPAGDAERSSNMEEEKEDARTEQVVVQEGTAKPAAACDIRGGNHNGIEDGTKKRPPPPLPTTPEAGVMTPPRPAAAAAPPQLRLPPQPPSAPPELASKSMERKSTTTTAAITAATWGPFALTRCKSEPMRNSPRLLLPEDYCFWKSHHHQHAVGAAGIGFGF